MSMIGTCLWFDDQAEEAANFYISVFRDSRVVRTAHYPEGAMGPAGSVMTVQFELVGEEFVALNGGPLFQFSPAVSLVVNCESQEEIDEYWAKLTADGGEESQCGWLTDKFGVSWQIVPREIDWLFGDAEPEAARRTYAAMLPMKKLDIAALRRAYEGA